MDGKRCSTVLRAVRTAGGSIAGLILDATGNLYGTTGGGGVLENGNRHGVVFKLTPSSDGDLDDASCTALRVAPTEVTERIPVQG